MSRDTGLMCKSVKTACANMFIKKTRQCDNLPCKYREMPYNFERTITWCTVHTEDALVACCTYKSEKKINHEGKVPQAARAQVTKTQFAKEPLVNKDSYGIHIIAPLDFIVIFGLLGSPDILQTFRSSAMASFGLGIGPILLDLVPRLLFSQPYCSTLLTQPHS